MEWLEIVKSSPVPRVLASVGTTIIKLLPVASSEVKSNPSSAQGRLQISLAEASLKTKKEMRGK